MDIEDWRSQIDEIDAAIVEGLNRRMACSLEIGKIKKAQGRPVYAPEREMAILSRVERLNGGPLSGAALKRIFQQIIEESRRLEQERSE
ncbi:MAG: chorismate mutase [Candidatus Handelsmanbacteria bacterium RIFCSPLOWO2_12_FULL_64_10]|uniref:Chorismate mutase n=1 Tax=Handelsmanbacteria sp. (strain RIFCSPLOWO2_12_FULL_64_10) TaxID=1817868 RepID=A0A1F6CL15_HANXR|nr:MAG: chorismate mutase [Candidatus Handelsmanbacteria bacterium RIFCSPLOWO2_12_FULL_64_10]